MEPRISIITLGVANLERSFHFYRDGLKLPTSRSPEDGIVFFQTNGVALALYPYQDLADDIGPDWSEPRSKFSGITLAHNVRERGEVDEVLASAKAAGAHIVKPAADTFWGGYSGYFADPDGYVWEVAWGAFEFNNDGSLQIT
ncbi:MAG: glyoxalase [Actinobacteria bacterium]|jgi:catechol 2,3-dioxygenase-like lactoylglutathione lyase family enzyme|nr:glyoxalase [Actinomycetota bacterium]